MLLAAVCDDERATRERVRDYLEALAHALHVKIEILLFESAEELLARYPQGLSLLFLDIQMEALSGMEAARAIRQKDRALTLIFMTSYAQYAVEGYSVDAYRFLLKPIQYSRFQQEVSDILLRLDWQRRETVSLKNDEGLFSLPVQDIAYIETLGGKMLRFHCFDRALVCQGALSHWEEELQKYHFFRCHTSYLVNMAYIRSIKRSTAMLSGAVEIPISKHRKKALMEAFTDYMGGLL